MMRELTVNLGERSYPIYIGEGLLQEASSYFLKHGISTKSPLMIITDSSVAERHLPALEQELVKGGFKTVSAVVPSGERSKSLSMLESLHEGAGGGIGPQVDDCGAGRRRCW